PKRGGQDQKDRPKVAEQQNRAAHQNEVTEIPAEECQTQKKKNFKGNNQNKRQQQVYMQKQPGTQQQQDTPAEQQASQQSGMPLINPPAQLERSVDSGAQNQPIP
ncbi:hypothetical protein A4A49_65464, partial [Nicotiana attenuata]